ncbi:MAG: lytic transglycosylase domain-containing protein [Alphaproteobacteria bacterium]|nr:lytic transglycosylase domain-containing protein [Alphaproteobacteria bacterium]
MPGLFKERSAATPSSWSSSSFFPVLSSVTAERQRCSLRLGWRLGVSGVSAVVLLVCSNAVHAQSIKARPPVGAPTTDGVAAFVEEASRRFAMPSSWIRAVMQAESGGDARALSPQGAMGLMQIMPDTWAELRLRYGLGTDPYDPHDNIAAGAAYLREMHDRYGEPGFLAAYNAGPDRYEEHLASGRPLPSETVSYMANVASLLEAIGNGTIVDALAAPTWASSPLFVVRPKAGSTTSGPSSSMPKPSLPFVQRVQATDTLAPHSEGLFASMQRRNGPQ